MPSSSWTLVVAATMFVCSVNLIKSLDSAGFFIQSEAAKQEGMLGRSLLSASESEQNVTQLVELVAKINATLEATIQEHNEGRNSTESNQKELKKQLKEAAAQRKKLEKDLNKLKEAKTELEATSHEQKKLIGVAGKEMADQLKEAATEKEKLEKEIQETRNRHEMEKEKMLLGVTSAQEKQKRAEMKLREVHEHKKKLQQEATDMKEKNRKHKSTNHDDVANAPYFDCQRMLSNITIVKELGRGKRKITFEVILPNGKRVAAKRCRDPTGKSDDCAKSLMSEGHLFERLFAQYGNQAIQYYGDCSFRYLNGKELKEEMKKHKDKYDEWLEKSQSDFSIGHTTFIEIGEPLMANWSNHKADSMPNHTAAEIEDFRVIARQYDNFHGGRLLLSGDCKFAHQYARVAAGIRNVDLDMVVSIAPPNESVLARNCGVLLGQYAGLRGNAVNCTEEYSREHGFLS